MPLESKEFSPRSIMKARRPHLFSDTSQDSEPILTEEYLQFLLKNLTSRKQEQVFEEFCRALAQVEICPNLRPQTGPTGGGDSKTDSSTYPVAPALALRSYFQSSLEATQENWAFAFSTAHKWKQKVTDDVAKIKLLNGPFTKIFYISNQFISDKKRAETEAALTQSSGITVIIHDLLWITSRVLENKRENLVYKYLGVQSPFSKPAALGIRDSERMTALNNLKAKLSDSNSYIGNDYALCIDYLEAALLARGLELPRHEVEGFFTRALRISENRGYPSLSFRIWYDLLWTQFWWYDDIAALKTSYPTVEALALASADTEDLEKLCNLFNLLFGALTHSPDGLHELELTSRGERIKTRLKELSTERDRPNNALRAKTQIHLLDLTLAGNKSPQMSEQCFIELAKCLKQSKHLGLYPTAKIIDNLSKLGEFYGNLNGYNTLFDYMCELQKDRLGEVEEGKLLLTRGVQLLSNNYEENALMMLGKARNRLQKEETYEECLHATLSLSDCYWIEGFYWAARTEALFALNQSARIVEIAHNFPVEAFIAAKRLSWIELTLGRLLPFIATYRVASHLYAQLVSLGFQNENVNTEFMELDGVAAVVVSQLSDVAFDPAFELIDMLDDINLPILRWAMLYRNNRYSDLVKDGWPQDIDQLEESFNKIATQPAASQITRVPPRYGSSDSTFYTVVYGVCISITAANDPGTVGLAENLLSIIEASFARANVANIAFIVDQVEVQLLINPKGAVPPDVVPAGNAYRGPLTYIWRTSPTEWIRNNPTKASEWLSQVFLSIFLSSTADPLDDISREMVDWSKDESPARAMISAPTLISTLNVLGTSSYDVNFWKTSTTSSI